MLLIEIIKDLNTKAFKAKIYLDSRLQSETFWYVIKDNMYLAIAEYFVNNKELALSDIKIKHTLIKDIHHSPEINNAVLDTIKNFIDNFDSCKYKVIFGKEVANE